jgi:MFS superfamily sulfate permease-like transporter
MLAGIGVIIILKQIPHALGYDKDFEGNLQIFDGFNLSEYLSGFNTSLKSIIIS